VWPRRSKPARGLGFGVAGASLEAKALGNQRLMGGDRLQWRGGSTYTRPEAVGVASPQCLQTRQLPP